MSINLGQSTVDSPGRLRGAVNLSAITFHWAGVEKREAHVRQEQAPPGERQGTSRAKTQNRQSLGDSRTSRSGPCA